MAIQFPKTRKIVNDRAKADVQSQLPQSNPFLKNSFLGALITGISGRVFEFYLQLRNALLEMFPDTATGAYLERWGSYVGITRNAPAPSAGYINLTGTPGVNIPLNTAVTASTGQVFKTQTEAAVDNIAILISSLTRVGPVTTAVTQLSHNLATGMSITIAGATPTEYNGVKTITVVDAVSFTFDVAGSPTTPATGTISAAADYARVLVTSTGTGVVQNQVSGTQLTVTSSIAGLGSIAYVTVDELGGAADVETEEAYRARVLFRYQNPVALFNANAIKIQAFKRAGVTRVWVKEAGTLSSAAAVTSITRSGYVTTVTTTSPHLLESGQLITISGATPADYNIQSKIIVLTDTTFAYSTLTDTPTTPATGTITYYAGTPSGQVRIYFVRDNDTNPIPTPSEVVSVRDLIEEIRPAHMYELDMIVGGPAPVATNFTFTSLLPNTSEMQDAITESLGSVFKDETELETNLISAAYLSAIWQAVDVTGARVNSFTLSSTADIVVPAGRLATLGTITYPA